MNARRLLVRSAAREKLLRGATALPDGVTIVKEMSLKDPEENMGVQVLREAAEKTGASSIDLKRGLDRAVKVAVTAIRQISRPVATPRERMQVATISAHNDPAIGQLVADAVEKVGPDGVITVEEAKTTETAEEAMVEGDERTGIQILGRAEEM